MYTVEWVETALQTLAQHWLDSDSALRQAITNATEQVDAVLAKDPFADSEDRPDGGRIRFFAPLGVVYQIEEDDETVLITRVWLFRKRGKRNPSECSPRSKCTRIPLTV